MSETETNQNDQNDQTNQHDQETNNKKKAVDIIYHGRTRTDISDNKVLIEDLYKVNYIFSYSPFRYYIITKITNKYIFMRRLKLVDDFKISECGGYETYCGRLKDTYYREGEEVINKISQKKLKHVFSFFDDKKYKYELNKQFIYTQDFGN